MSFCLLRLFICLSSPTVREIRHHVQQGLLRVLRGQKLFVLPVCMPIWLAYVSLGLVCVNLSILMFVRLSVLKRKKSKEHV